MNAHSDSCIPSWLETPPLSQINPPVTTRQQELPFAELAWEDFERLCLRLARLEADVEHCQLYGERGQEQGGIDLYARQKLAGQYSVYQCKREKAFSSAKIKAAVAKFLEGEWAHKANTFVLCTQESLRTTQRADEFEAQQALLKKRAITFLPWDKEELSSKLKNLPNLVDDFFGRAWVVVFCGQEAAERLGKRLDATQISEFRRKCGTFYRHVFNTHDPGLPIAAHSNLSALSLEHRYVFPDVYDQRTVTISPSPPANDSEIAEHESRQGTLETLSFERNQQTSRSQPQPVVYQQRHTIENWLVAAQRSIVLGDPGSGKSTLLRFIAIDLLEESPRLTVLSQQWGQFLPVWVPFALWTRMIAEQATAACSLSDLLHTWLASWDEERLWPLIEQALTDERLLLLVDGLDEWANEAAARLALDRLKVFIEQRGVPAIVTSRPHGFNRLGMQETGWQLGALSDFSLTQQQQLSRIWFTYRVKSAYHDATYEEREIEQKVQTETDGFFTELQHSADLRELAKVPLLLCLLIYHRFHSARLPQSRFKAYDSLIEHLIATHPHKRRKAAALLADTSSELADDDIKGILACLAYRIQKHYAEGVIDDSTAIHIVEDYLKDCEHGLGFTQRAAHQQSRKTVEIGEGTLGLLVRRSSKDIGFFHRVFQEYLAAHHLSRLPLAEQIAVAEYHCVDPQWHETLLGLFHITKRVEDIKQLADCIKAMRTQVNTAEQYAIDLLLCELAFGEFSCSPSLAKDLAQDAFEQVELGSWMPHRERLLQHILDGLRSTRVKELVKSKLSGWFPCRAQWRESIFEAIGRWPRSPEVVECLWHGIHDEEPNNQRAAARAFADLAAGDLDMGNRLASLACSAVDPKMRAAALEALLRGWPEHATAERAIDMARHSMSPELRLIAILGRIQRQAQTDADRVEVLRLGAWETGVEYHWRDDVASALMSGWPTSPQIKAACFKALQRYVHNQYQLERGVALRILLEGYPQDEDVAQFCVGEITHEQYPLNFSGANAFDWLSKHFHNHPRIVEAIDEWIPRQEHRVPEIAQAALVGCTPKAKAKLLSSLNSLFPHWPAWALLKGWGMHDTEVAESLMEMACGPVTQAAQIGHLLPQIIEEKPSCRRRLLELLQDPQCGRLDFVMEGLTALGNTQGDTEVVDVLFNSVLPRIKRESWDYEALRVSLISAYAVDPRVKTLAKQALSERPGWNANGLYAAVARTYGDDEDLQHKVLASACPLPASLRKIIAAFLGTGSLDEAFAMSMLKLYDHEAEDEVKTQASIGYHTLLKASEIDVQSTVETLSRSIVCVGPDYRDRRRAAFCGLSILDRLDILVNAREDGGKRHCDISVVEGVSPNVPLVKYFLQNWDGIKAALDDESWLHLSSLHADPLYLWDAFCMFADQYPSPRDEALRFLETRLERTAKPNILRFLGRALPKSRLLLEYCLQALDIGHTPKNGSWQEVVIAGELLGSHFGSDNNILAHMMSLCPPGHIRPGIILALCEGWPESDELKQLFELVSNQNASLPYATYFQLISRKCSSEAVFDELMNVLSTVERSTQWHVHTVARPILRRLQMDDSFLAMLSGRLLDTPTPSEKATIPKLIQAARGVSSELKTWCVEEMERQISGEISPQIGFDMIYGEPRPVAHALLDVLSHPGWVESSQG